MRHLLPLIALLTSPHLHAAIPWPDTEEVHVGNGGDVVVCYSDASRTTIANVQLLDFYEAETLRDFTIELGDPAQSVDAKMESMFARIDRFDTGRATRYREWYQRMQTDSRYQPNARLTDIPDSAHVALPRDGHCAIEQIAIHRDPMFPTDRRYLFDATLVDWLKNHGRNNDLAGLMLHELIYREAIGDGVTHSIGVRYLNALIAADRLKDETTKSYVDTMRTVGFRTAFLNGLWLDISELGSPHFHPGSDDQIYQGFIATPSPYPWDGQQILLTCFVRFYEDGTLRSFSPSGMGNIKLQAFGRELTAYGLHGYAGADRERCIRRPDHMFDIDFDGEDRTKLSGARLTTLTEVTSDRFNLKLGYYVTFDANGAVNGGATDVDRHQWVSFAGTTCDIDKGHVEIGENHIEVPLTPCTLPTDVGNIDIFGPARFDYAANQIVGSMLSRPQQLPPRGANTLTEFFGSLNRLDPRNEIMFDPHGHVINGYLNQDAYFCWARNPQQCSYIPRYSQVFFDHNGLLTYVNYRDDSR
jgi:hypothetical protein